MSTEYDRLLSACDYFLKAAKKRKPWSKKPRGWKQYSRTMMKGEDHPFTACVEKMKDKMDNPEGFCASVKDRFKNTTNWRSTEKLKKKKKSKKSSKKK